MALVRNRGHIEGYLTIPNNLSFTALQSSVTFAEDNFAKKILGDALYNSLDEAITAETETDKQKALLYEVRKVIGYMAFSKYAMLGNAKVTDFGITAVHTQNEKPAFEWQVKDIVREAQEMAYKAVDDLLVYLEGVKADFSDWTAAPSFTEYQELFLPTAKMFSSCWHINNSRLTYLALVPKIRFVEEFYLDSLLCDTYVDELRTEFKNNSLTADNAKIMNLLQHYIARRTIENGIDALCVETSVFGLSRNYATNTVNSSRPADAEERERLVQRAAEEAELYKLKLIAVLYKNIDSYPTYKAGSCYVDPEVDSEYPDKKIKQFNSFLRT